MSKTLDETDVQAWCDNVVVGTEQPEGLVRIVPEVPAE